MNKQFHLQIKNRLNRLENNTFFAQASLSSKGIRRKEEPLLEQDYRLAYSVDSDRILHSRAYSRYIDKTQVFYLIQNDHITHRVLHVQLASKIARTIGKFLGLNNDLIEAIALGHDIGHTPFGHDGERCLSQICLSLGIGNFLHNLQSVQFLDQVERKGQGLNLCLQTLDGILTHDGEIHNQRLYPEKNKTFEIFDKEIREKKESPAKQIVPMTMEGCVVRLSDTISYIGRDIEDAIRLKIIRRSDIPRDCSNVLGDTNGKIVYRLVTDVVETSHEKEYVGFSHEASEALKRLKEFNLNRIYFNPKIKTELKTIKELFTVLFERFLSDLEKENRKSSLYTGFLENMSEEYIRKHRPEEIVRDFIAGMTDTYFLNQCPENLRPAFRVIV